VRVVRCCGYIDGNAAARASQPYPGMPVTSSSPSARRVFQLILVKPSHYDDDGYVIQWMRSIMPSNSLSAVYGLALDCADRQVLGEDVEIRIEAYDETNLRISADRIAKQIQSTGGHGLVCLVGVQSNQYPRALDLAKQFRARGLPTCIGGFHVSGSLSMLPGERPELRAAMDAGISLFAGELEERRFDQLLQAADRDELEPLYNYLDDLPDLEGAPTPFLPAEKIQRVSGLRTTFDAGRGCPFSCSFCTIINVQGRKTRHRSPDDVERIIRLNAAQGITSFFITDDNFARNTAWEATFDRIALLREEHGMKVNLFIQVDTMCHKIPGFIEKAARAGVKRVFVGLESINPDTLKSAQKGQNQITEYRRLFQSWHDIGVLIYAGYILGFPNDTAESIEKDIGIIQRELPVDMLEFFILTPLPGSQDHRELFDAGIPMDEDLNNYDTVHAVTDPQGMSREELLEIYDRVWDLYYSDEHLVTMMRRARVWCKKPKRILRKVFGFWTIIRLEKVHPLEGGLLRRRYRRDRRPGLPIENPLVFYPRQGALFLVKAIQLARTYFRYMRLLKQVQNEDPAHWPRDIAMEPAGSMGQDSQMLELFTVTESARETVDRARRKAERREAAKQQEPVQISG